MNERKPKIVWEDHNHSWSWGSLFAELVLNGYELTVFDYFTAEGVSYEREQLLKDADIYVVHSGTINPPDMSEMIIAIKKDRNIKILLQTEAINPLTEPLIDGVISVHEMLEPKELMAKLDRMVTLPNTP